MNKQNQELNSLRENYLEQKKMLDVLKESNEQLQSQKLIPQEEYKQFQEWKQSQTNPQ